MHGVTMKIILHDCFYELQMSFRGFTLNADSMVSHSPAINFSLACNWSTASSAIVEAGAASWRSQSRFTTFSPVPSSPVK